MRLPKVVDILVMPRAAVLWGSLWHATALCRFLHSLGPGLGELNNRLVQKGVPPELQKVEQIEAIVQQATQTAGRPAWAMDDWLS